MNPFEKYTGILLNGRHIGKDDLSSVKPRDSFENEVTSFVSRLFDEGESILIQTSGSTGTPKQLKFPKSALIQSAAATNNFFGLNSGAKALLALPLSYVAGKLMVVRAIIGRYQLLTSQPSANPLQNENGPLSFVPMTPHQAATALKENPLAFDQVETVLLGGGTLSDDLRRQLNERQTRFFLGFGMAETLTHFALADLSAQGETIYKTLPDTSISTDGRGRLTVNRRGITEDDVITNDLVELLGGGFKWLGRADNLINSGGVKVIPERVEIVLKPFISSPFFIAGIPDGDLGQLVTLFIEGDEQVNLDKPDFENPYHKPRKVVNLNGFIRTESEKIKRRETVNKWLLSPSN